MLDLKGIKNKIICFFKGHIHKKEDTELDLIGGEFQRLHDFETDYKNK